MSIYATLWRLKFPALGDDYPDCDWVDVIAQAVPAHIDGAFPFLWPPVPVDAPHARAVVCVRSGTPKGSTAHAQEYLGPLLILTGDEYSRITFDALHTKLCDALRGNMSPVV